MRMGIPRADDGTGLKERVSALDERYEDSPRSSYAILVVR
jgi:hypothetical protein